MANARIIDDLLVLLDRLERREINVYQLEAQAENCASALEGITSTEITRFRDFEARIVTADFEDEDFPGEDRSSVINEFKLWLRTLPQ